MSESPATTTATIRVFRIEDYDAVLALWKESNLPCKPRGRDSRANLQKQMDLPMVRFLAAEINGTVVGTVLASHDGRKGWINRLAVTKEFRRKGLAGLLLKGAEHWLEGEGIGIIACLIEDDNAPSVRFFLGAGYTRHADIIYFSRRRSKSA